MKYILKTVLSALLLFALLPAGVAYAQAYEEGSSYFGRNNYIEYMCGGFPLIISAPHGGQETPGELPDRTCGTTVTDSYTYELSQELREALFRKTGRYPHVIVCHLKRIKLDANRNLPEATCGNATAEISWLEYQKYIDSAKVAVTRDFSKGLFIDLHGQSSHGERIELGYLISGSELQLSYSELNTSYYINKSSIRNLATDNIGGLSFVDLLRGTTSFGTMIDDKGYAVIPSYYEQFPTTAFYSGGYNTERHGSRDEGTIDGIQIECNRDIRFDEGNRLEFAEDLAEILLAYLDTHYFENLEDFYDPSLGRDDVFKEHNISFFPNPVRDMLHVRVESELELNIYNLQGQEVYSEQVRADKDISLSGLKRGMYIIAFSREGEVVAKDKLVIDPGY